MAQLVHDFHTLENVKETVAGLPVPVNYVPAVLSALLIMSTVLLIGTAAAFNMARGQVDLLTEEYGWPLLYSGGGVTGFITVALGMLLALVALSIPAIGIYRIWVIATEASTS